MSRHRVDVVQAMNLNDPESLFRLEDRSAYRWRILAEGDSWFTIGAIPSSNLLYQLRLSRTAVILNLGYPGDTIANMSQLSRNTEFARRLAHPNWATKWDAVLMSAGGNDLIDQAYDLLVQAPAPHAAPEDCVDQERLREFCKGVTEGFERIVEQRDSAASPNKGIPVVLHTYDYPTPRPAPANFLFLPMTRPWLLPAFQRRQVPPDMHIPISRYLLDALAETLLKLESSLPHVRVVDTRNRLKPARAGAKGNSGDWLNEIHPNSDGYKKIAKALQDELKSVLAAG
jgi:lysophospholipase L1-like esterase